MSKKPTEYGSWADPEPKYTKPVEPETVTVNVVNTVNDLAGLEFVSEHLNKAFAGILPKQAIGRITRDFKIQGVEADFVVVDEDLTSVSTKTALQPKKLSPQDHMEFIKGMMEAADKLKGIS